MSILIKGMDMPKGCAWCHFRKHGSINEFEYFCGITNSRIAEMYDRTGWEDMRAADCPLIEIPTPHGRLIDEQEALDCFDIYKTPSRETVDFMAIGYNHGVADCQAILKGLPTIIETEKGAEE